MAEVLRGVRETSMKRDIENPGRRRALDDIMTICRNLMTDQHGFELACGDGYWTDELADTRSSVLATDINPGLLEQAKTASCRRYCVQFAVADCAHPKVEGESPPASPVSGGRCAAQDPGFDTEKTVMTPFQRGAKEKRGIDTLPDPCFTECARRYDNPQELLHQQHLRTNAGALLEKRYGVFISVALHRDRLTQTTPAPLGRLFHVCEDSMRSTKATAAVERLKERSGMNTMQCRLIVQRTFAAGDSSSFVKAYGPQKPAAARPSHPDIAFEKR
ncbi:hypothetical protein FQR65_LT20774 [Abscondita terminalis]|nr:hypothetical protein FQR65_LT20774 [Abscondita terminalis]